MVASIMAYRYPDLRQGLEKTSQTPLAAQREKRLWMFFQSTEALRQIAPRGA